MISNNIQAYSGPLFDSETNEAAYFKHIQQCISTETKESVKISGNLSQTLVKFLVYV